MSTAAHGRHAPKTGGAGFTIPADGKKSANQVYSQYLTWHKTNHPDKTPLSFKEWMPVAIKKGVLNKEGTFSADATPSPGKDAPAAAKTAPALPKKSVVQFVKDHKLVFGLVAIAVVGYFGYKAYRKHHHKGATA